MPANTYTWPAKSALQGEANREILSQLEYKCLTCSTTMNQAATLKMHIEGKKHIAKTAGASNTENPKVLSQCEQYAALEAPHRELNKSSKDGKWKEKIEKLKADQAAMSPEELKAQKAEWKAAKRQREEDGTAPPKKKAKKGNFTCDVCGGLEMNGQDTWDLHVAGKKHLNNLAKSGGTAASGGGAAAALGAASGAWGCMICGLAAPVPPNHFDGAKHKRKAAQAGDWGGFGSDVNTLQALAMMLGGGWGEDAAPAQKKGNAAQEKKVIAKAAAAPKAKADPKADPKAKAKAKANNPCKGEPKAKIPAGGGAKPVGQQGAAKAGAADSICWSHLKGTCKKGAACPWKHS